MSSLRPKKGTAEYAEQCADDPSDFIDDEPEEDNATTKAKYEKEIAELTTKLEQSELEKKAAVAVSVKLQAQVADAGASAATPGSGKKIIYTDAMHKITHAKVEALTVPALLELKKLENNYEAI